MDRAIYVAMTGAIQTVKAQTANSHNIANAHTIGFRAELLNNQQREVVGAGLPSRVNALAVEPGARNWDDSMGAYEATGRDLDVALREDTWLAVQAPDGSEAYTKAGDLRLDANGLLRTAAGHFVLGDGGPIAIPPNTQISIGGDGTVSMVPQGSGPETMASIARIRTVSATSEQLDRGLDGLMRAREGVELPAASGTVMYSGTLETSNANLPEAMVNMISLARQFEMQVKVMRTAEENERASASLLRVSGQ